MRRKSGLTLFSSFKAVALLVSLLWLGAWSAGAMAAPVFQAAGTAVSGTGVVNPAWPAHQIDDIALLFVESTGGQAATLSIPAGFVAVAGSPQSTGIGTNGTRITVFWARATSTTMATPRVADPGDHVYARILTYRGVINTGNPWDVTGGGVKAAASTSVTVTGVTTTVPDTLIVQAVARDLDSTAAAFSAETNANLTGIAERSDAGTTSGNGGGFAVWDGVMATAGATGNTTATVTSSINAFLTIALKPPSTTVFSIDRANPDPSTAATVSWTVTFANSVTGVDATAFTLVPGGLSGAFITSVTGSGTTWTVTANTGIGSGTLGLDQTGPGSISPTLTGTFTGQVYTISATPALAEYRMDEAGWNGTAGEVVDTSGSYPGTAMNSANTTDGSRAIAGSPGTCRYGIFDNGGSITQGYVALPGFPNLTTDFTITAWIRTTNNTVGAQRILIDDETNTGGYGLSLGEGGTGALRFYARGSSVLTIDTPLNTIANNTWYFVAGVADISNGIRSIYVYDASGNLLPGMPVSAASTGWGTDPGMASIGGETNASGEPPATNHFKGNLDEVRVYPKVLTQSALTALATQTHTCAVIVPTPGGFNAYETSTAAGAITGVIKTKTAGSAISLDMIALNTAKTAILTGFADTVRVEVLDSSDNTGALDANNCRSTWTTIQTLSPDPAFAAGDNGRKTISFTVPDAYRDARLRITYPAGAPTTTGCSTDNFAIRPSAFTGVSVSDTDWQTAGTGRTLNDVTFGTVTHKAGRPFSVRANAVNAAGTPAITANYTGTPTATLTACAGAACTATFGAFSLNTAFVSGQLASDVATYDNAGSLRLQLVDSSFSSVDSGDSTALERNITSAVIDVGRFVPDHFTVSLNTPAFGTVCGAGSFTYVGQPFNYTAQPVITVQAQNFANATTTLYTGSWWRMTNASLTGKSYTAASGTVDTSGITGTDPVISDAGGGSGTLTFGSGSGLFFTRTTPVVPFNAELSLAINVIDADGVAYASNPASFGTASAGNGITFSSGKQMRFGRLRVGNANGSQLLPLNVQMQAQYWGSTGTGNSFITNTADSCTALAATDFALGNYQKNLNACETSITVGSFASGRSTVQLSAPGNGNNGSVDLMANLGAAGSGTTCIAGVATPVTGANRAYLQGNWSGGAYDQNPTARAAFGVYRGAEEVIHIRENY